MTNRQGQAVWIFALLFAAGLAPADAQQPAAVQSPPAPQRTTATYQDWTVQCEIAAPSQQKICEMAQATQAPGQANPVTKIAIGRPTKTAPMKVVVQVPINVWLPAGVKFTADAKEPGVETVYTRCVPTACFAEFALKEESLQKFRTLTANGTLSLKDAAQQDVAIPVSFKGFAQAYDALRKESL